MVARIGLYVNIYFGGTLFWCSGALRAVARVGLFMYSIVLASSCGVEVLCPSCDMCGPIYAAAGIAVGYCVYSVM